VTPPIGTSAAELAAAKNLSANLSALWQTQPKLAEMLGPPPVDFTWVYGRDGFLTAQDANGQWFAGCSVPLAAGRSLLKSLEISTLHNCILDPPHAGLLRAAFERLHGGPALMVVAPELTTIRVMLCCDDFSDFLAAHQLWFITGQDWAEDFRRLLTERPGLCTPGRFIRTKLLAEATSIAMITQAQNVFSEILQERTRRIEEIRVESKAGQSEKVLLIAGSNFRLWDEASTVLAEQIQPSLQFERFDSDDPAASSPLALAEAAAPCRAVIVANVSRGDASNLVAMRTPWITWVTWPRVPAFTAAGPRDELLVADAAWQATAVSAGWPIERVAVAPWPIIPVAGGAGSPSLVIIADTQLIEIPDSIASLSSHVVLWDRIAGELRADPLALGEDVGQYLNQRAEMCDISPGSVDVRRFVENLIIPAYQQGLARVLLAAGLPLRVYGAGWNTLDEFCAINPGPVRSRQEFQSAIAAASALVYVWPMRHAHPMDALGKPIVHPTGRRAESFIRQARQAISAQPKPAVLPDSPATIAATILKILSSPDKRGYDVAA